MPPADLIADASPEEKRAIGAAFLHIQARVQAANRYRDEVRPAAGSLEAKELLAWRGNYPGATAEMLIVSSNFHLLTLAAVLSGREPLYPFGGFTLLRGAAEPSARAAWIMDPAIMPFDRRARVLVERLSALYEMKKFKNLRKHAEERIADLVTDAEALGHHRVDGKRLKPEHFGQARPDATNLFGRLLPNLLEPDGDAPGSRLYRVLSAFSHSTLWAILAQRQSEEDFQPGMKATEVVLNVDWLIGQLGEVLKLHNIAMRRLAGQIGEGPERWDRVLKGLPSPTGPGRAPITEQVR
jgi:hypothetical protein